jgi:5-formyltetrahydrofolate cyclo-ligase
MVLTGSCPCPGPWFRTHGAHLQLQAREDPHPTAAAVPSTDFMSIVSQKQTLRAQAKSRRATLAGSLPDFAERIAHFIDELAIVPGTSVGGYQALSEEADPSQLLSALQARKCEISYPRVHAKAQPLRFHVTLAGEAWRPGTFGVLEPRPDWPRAFPSMLLVPLLAFDAEGHRLGYGGGYYDRTLHQFRGERAMTAIGVCYAGQEIAEVPHDASDEKLDMVVTEQGVRRFRER